METDTENDTRQDLLDRLRAAAKGRDWLKDKLAEAESEVNDLIREGFAMTPKISGQVLADAAGLSKPRAYQIRDGRR